MPTTVGSETNANDLITNLLRLEHDAIAAYESVIDKLDDPDKKAKVAEFKSDHDRHVSQLRSIAGQIGVETPKGGDIKKMLTTGKIALANLAGDKAILRAMKTNEDDTVQAYTQAAGNDVASPEWKEFLETARADEERHRAWFASAA